jgi:hypothetical protein
MGGDSNYADVQQPAGVYGDAGAPSSSYADLGLLQKGAGPAPAPPPAPSPASPPAPSPDDVAAAMVDTLSKIYKKKYSWKKDTSKIGKKITVKLVDDSDMTAALTENANNVGNEIIQDMLTYNPQEVQDRLRKYYSDIGEPFPSNLNTIDKNTKLNKEQQGILFGFVKGELISEARKDVDATQGFFARPQNPGDGGTIFVRSEFAQSDRFQSNLAGTIGHELAHAYADDVWRDFLGAMLAVNMLRTGKLEEGMATFIENEIVTEWLKTQPPKTLRPPLGYTDDPEVAGSAETFIKAVGRDWALGAFFHGWITVTDPDKAPDTIVLETKHKKKKWRWPWRT